MDENQRFALPRLVINQMASTSIKDSGRKNRGSDCVRDFRRFRRFEGVTERQDDRAEQTRAQAYAPEPILRKKFQVSSTLPEPGVICPITFEPVFAATSST